MFKESVGFPELLSPVKNNVPIDNAKFETRISAYAPAHFVYFGTSQRIPDWKNKYKQNTIAPLLLKQTPSHILSLS